MTTVTIIMATIMMMVIILLQGMLMVTTILMVTMIMTITMLVIIFRCPQFPDVSQFFNRIRRRRSSILDPFTSSSKKDA